MVGVLGVVGVFGGWAFRAFERGMAWHGLVCSGDCLESFEVCGYLRMDTHICILNFTFQRHGMGISGCKICGNHLWSRFPCAKDRGAPPHMEAGIPIKTPRIVIEINGGGLVAMVGSAI